MTMISDAVELIKDYRIGIVLKQPILLDYFIEQLNDKIINEFIDDDKYHNFDKIDKIAVDTVKKSNQGKSFHYITGYYGKNIIQCLFSSENEKIAEDIIINYAEIHAEEMSLLITEIKDLIIKIYHITKPLFIRSSHEGGAGGYVEDEIVEKKIYSLHWMQIFTEEMLASINIVKLKKSNNFYSVVEMQDGSVFIQITENPEHTYKLIKDLSDEIEIKCPEMYKWWEQSY